MPKKFCKKLIYNEGPKLRIRLGIVLSEDENFIKFKTAQNEYEISKKCIVSMNETDREFYDTPEYQQQDEPSTSGNDSKTADKEAKQ